MQLDGSLRRLASPLERLDAAWRFDRGCVARPAQRSKRRHLLALFEERGHDTLVETGTYLGETVRFFVPHARRIFSIEVDPSLHDRAARLFGGDENVEIMLGDALEVAPRVVSALDGPCLLWLDGHFSGGATGRGELDEPVVEILRRIGGTEPPRGMTIVVDDLRRFGIDAGVPTLDTLINTAREAFPGSRTSVELDSLVIRAG